MQISSLFTHLGHFQYARRRSLSLLVRNMYFFNFSETQPVLLFCLFRAISDKTDCLASFHLSTNICSHGVGDFFPLGKCRPHQTRNKVYFLNLPESKRSRVCSLNCRTSACFLHVGSKCVHFSDGAEDYLLTDHSLVHRHKSTEPLSKAAMVALLCWSTKRGVGPLKSTSEGCVYLGWISKCCFLKND